MIVIWKPDHDGSRVPRLFRESIIQIALGATASHPRSIMLRSEVVSVVNLVLSQAASGRALEAMGVSWIIAVSTIAVSTLPSLCSGRELN